MSPPLTPAERKIAMVFQSYALFPHLSVAENIIFGLRVRGVSRAERDSRLKRVADIVGLSHLLERKPSQLSGGQRQRVALGRAIIAEARVCLMDEPLSNLDAKLRHEMRTEIRALQQRLGMTMVYVTHDQTEAMTMADRVVLMRDGHVEQNGPPEELYSRPATAFTARFIGTPPMNLITSGEAGPSAFVPSISTSRHRMAVRRGFAASNISAPTVSWSARSTGSPSRCDRTASARLRQATTSGLPGRQPTSINSTRLPAHGSHPQHVIRKIRRPGNSAAEPTRRDKRRNRGGRHEVFCQSNDSRGDRCAVSLTPRIGRGGRSHDVLPGRGRRARDQDRR